MSEAVLETLPNFYSPQLDNRRDVLVQLPASYLRSDRACPAATLLHQDLASQLPGAIKHDYFPKRGQYSRDLLVHDVEVTEGSRLARLLGAASVAVNSMHHQGIKQLAPGLRASAHAPDGLIEGLEAPNGRFLLGVQWHPEALVDRDPRMGRLFAALIQAATR